MQLKRSKEKITGSFVPSSINLEARTVDVTWSMGGKVRRKDPEYGLFYGVCTSRNALISSSITDCYVHFS